MTIELRPGYQNRNITRDFLQSLAKQYKPSPVLRPSKDRRSTRTIIKICFRSTSFTILPAHKIFLKKLIQHGLVASISEAIRMASTDLLDDIFYSSKDLTEPIILSDLESDLLNDDIYTSSRDCMITLKIPYTLFQLITNVISDLNALSLQTIFPDRTKFFQLAIYRFINSMLYLSKQYNLFPL